MDYNQIRMKVPEGLPRKKRAARPLGPKSAILFFILQMLVFAVFGSMIQRALRLPGVLITELMFLMISILYIKWKGHRLRDAFPIKKPKLTTVFGTLLMWIGGYLTMLIGNLLIASFFPQFPSSSDSQVMLSSNLNWVLIFIIVAISPAICEEAMHRGVIQYGMKQKIKDPWTMALVIGVIFGLFHMDVSKFFSTALLGAVMGWIMFQTNNMFYTSLMHFVHNGIQVIMLAVLSLTYEFDATFDTIIGTNVLPLMRNLQAGFLSAAADHLLDLQLLTGTIQDTAITVDETAAMLFSTGIVTILFGILIPLLMYCGNYLILRDIAPRRPELTPKDPEKRRRVRRFLVLSIGGFVILGFITIVASIFYI